MAQGIKLISLNIEMDRHLPRVIPFLQKENADVVCLQEVLLRDLPMLQNALGMTGGIEPVSVVDVKLVNGEVVTDEELVKKGAQGVGFFTRLPILRSGVSYYFGEPGTVPRHSQSYNRFLLWREVEKEGARYMIGATHFTWTSDGETDDVQRRDAQTLLNILSGFPEIVFCGDFNAPRGNEVWSILASRYRDNIPSSYETSIDPELHRVKGLKRMVDGLFSTPGYRLSDVRLESGVSDHCAIVSTILRVR